MGRYALTYNMVYILGRCRVGIVRQIEGKNNSLNRGRCV